MRPFVTQPFPPPGPHQEGEALNEPEQRGGGISGSDTTGPGMRPLGRSQASPQMAPCPLPRGQASAEETYRGAATHQETTGFGSPSTRMLMVTSWPSLTDWSISET